MPRLLTAGLAVLVSLTLAGEARAQVIISEVATAGPDFVELVNAGTTGVALGGLQLERKIYTCENQASPLALPAITLKPGQHWLAGGFGDPLGLVIPDDLFLGDIDQLQGEGGAVWLTRTEPAQVLDKVAWGTGTECGEGAVTLTAVTPGSSLERLGGGRQDTNVNGDDLVVRGVAAPQNLLVIDDRDGDGVLDDVDACIASA